MYVSGGASEESVGSIGAMGVAECCTPEGEWVGSWGGGRVWRRLAAGRRETCEGVSPPSRYRRCPGAQFTVNLHNRPSRRSWPSWPRPSSAPLPSDHPAPREWPRRRRAHMALSDSGARGRPGHGGGGRVRSCPQGGVVEGFVGGASHRSACLWSDPGASAHAVAPPPRGRIDTRRRAR